MGYVHKTIHRDFDIISALHVAASEQNYAPHAIVVDENQGNGHIFYRNYPPLVIEDETGRSKIHPGVIQWYERKSRPETLLQILDIQIKSFVDFLHDELGYAHGFLDFNTIRWREREVMGRQMPIFELLFGEFEDAFPIKLGRFMPRVQIDTDEMYDGDYEMHVDNDYRIAIDQLEEII